MTNTLSKKEKIQKLVDEWDRFKKITQEQIGDELGVSGKTIYAWREKLKKGGINLELKKGGKTDNDIFDAINSPEK